MMKRFLEWIWIWIMTAVYFSVMAAGVVGLTFYIYLIEPIVKWWKGEK